MPTGTGRDRRAGDVVGQQAVPCALSRRRLRWEGSVPGLRGSNFRCCQASGLLSRGRLASSMQEPVRIGGMTGYRPWMRLSDVGWSDLRKVFRPNHPAWRLGGAGHHGGVWPRILANGAGGPGQGGAHKVSTCHGLKEAIWQQDPKQYGNTPEECGLSPLPNCGGGLRAKVSLGVAGPRDNACVQSVRTIANPDRVAGRFGEIKLVLSRTGSPRDSVSGASVMFTHEQRRGSSLRGRGKRW